MLSGIKINVPLLVGEEEPPNSFSQEESVDDHTEAFLRGHRDGQHNHVLQLLAPHEAP